MISFSNDYSEGACPEILEALCRENYLQNDAYGCDAHCAAAAAAIKALCRRDDLDVHFLVGGTPVNLISLTAFLRPYQAAIAVDSGHIASHEAGSIEATGHKVCTISGKDGKLTPALVREVLAHHNMPEHMVQPKLVYISNSTEIGTIYTKAELQELRRVCDAFGLYLYLDGARLASALTAAGSDVTLADLAQLCDAFYIGGTKNGALIGEALVVVNDVLKTDFRYIEKQRGGMLAKGWLIGLQFEQLLQNDLYFSLARHANAMAEKLRAGFAAHGVSFFAPSPTNQLFPILPKKAIAALEQQYVFQFWDHVDDTHDAVRFVTSWATPEEHVDTFLLDLAKSL
ncbi:MAG: beta-eliminating lyase-related protein [Pygmaiobacter sp.]